MGPRTAHSSRGEATPTLNTGRQPPLVIGWLDCVWYTPGRRGLPSWLPWYPTNSYWACCRQHPQVPFCRAALQPLLSQFVLVPCVTPPQLQNPALQCVKFHATDDCPMLHLIYIPLQGLWSLKRANNTSQFGVVSKLASCVFDLNRTSPRIEPWGTLLLTGRQSDVALFTTTPWALPPSQFFTQYNVYLLIP